MLNTDICAAMSLLTWTMMDVIFYRNPSLIGAINGMITGLVAITPGAGFVAGWGAIVMGGESGQFPLIKIRDTEHVSLLWYHTLDQHECRRS